jgi:cyanophycin synthetase
MKALRRMRIVRAGISVYEVEVNLGSYSKAKTNQLDGFSSKLVRAFPALRKHECFHGEAGGFVRELRAGTDLAHVMEHLILELLKMSSRSHRRLSGWTRKQGSNYVIHFQAPDAAKGRMAATGALKIIDGLLSGKRINKVAIIRSIRDAKEDGSCN